jgi:hypothetical protein
MPTPEYLIVPIKVSALVVNDAVRIGQTFQRWYPDYKNLMLYQSPEPAPFSGASQPSPGVYLKWELPYALRQGAQNNITGSTKYPLVPNRWLVVRYSGPLSARTAAGWVIESDFLDPDLGTSPFLDPFAATVTPTSIGRAVSIASSPYQDKNAHPLFLTAVAPALPAFAAYQPYNNCVFSFQDPLEDVAAIDTLSYFVAGWYSEAKSDILQQYPDFQTAMAGLNWGIAQKAAGIANQTICSGIAQGIAWDAAGPAPVSHVPAPGKVTLAVGNTTVDALTAMIAHQAADNHTIDPMLLEALQYDLLAVIDEPDGPDKLRQAIHTAWFSAHDGGYDWQIVDNPDNKDPQPDAGELAYELTWCAALNRAQLDYDEAVRLLADLQWQLYVMWWKQGNAQAIPPYPDDNSPTQFQQALDPGVVGSLAHKVAQQKTLVDDRRKAIPWGVTPKDLADAIADYAATKKLPASRLLKRGSSSQYYEAKDPVLLMSGLNAAGLLTDLDELECRLPSQLVGGFRYGDRAITTADMGKQIPLPDLANLPGPLAGLLDEFFFLDPNDAAMVARVVLGSTDKNVVDAVKVAMEDPAHAIGIVPAIDLARWAQPWSPLYLLWQVSYYPIPYASGGAPNWKFDGTGYQWTGPDPQTEMVSLTGRIFLTPQAVFNFRSQLEKYLKQYPDPPLQGLDKFIADTDHWDLLSQTLDGFNAALLRQDVMANVAPGGAMAELVGPHGSIPPLPGARKKVPFKGWPAGNFQQYRSGQFYLARLDVVDRFGQVVEVFTSQNNLTAPPPIIAPGLIPERYVNPVAANYLMQTSPRLLQPSRILFDFVSSTKDSELVRLAADVNPVCAWLVSNRLDRALMVFDNQGKGLGELRNVRGTNRQTVASWSALPDSKYTTTASLAADFPHVAEFLEGLVNAGADAFAAFLACIDESLWTIDPASRALDGKVASLVGRPLALVRTRLAGELDGPPVFDSSWQYTFKTPPVEFTGYDFPVRLGDLAMLSDGLIGYFEGKNYGRFNAVHIPRPSPYLVRIGNGNYIDLSFQSSGAKYLTAIMDPRSAVHVISDILPVTTLAIPQQFAGLMRNIEVAFRIGPVLSGAQDVVSGDVTTSSVILPRPPDRHGDWKWRTVAPGGGWSSNPVVPANGLGALSGLLPEARTGMLQLSATKKKENKP